MATTEDAIVDRIRAVCTANGYVEAVGWDFERTPLTAVEARYVVMYDAQVPNGGMNGTEEARGTVDVQVARSLNGDYDATRRTLLQDMRTLLAGIVDDGATASGDYAVEDGGRAMTVEAPRGASYLIGRLRLSLNFEATL